MRRNSGLGSLLLAGAAAYGIYKLSKMSPTERTGLLDKGKKLITDNVEGLKGVLGGENSRSQSSHLNIHDETPHSYS
jgi:hypothetical protein